MHFGKNTFGKDKPLDSWQKNTGEALNGLGDSWGALLLRNRLSGRLVWLS